MMHLVPNWRAVLKHAWSVKVLFLAAVFSGFEVILPLIGHRLPIDDITRAALYFLIVVVALVSRFVLQRSLRE